MECYDGMVGAMRTRMRDLAREYVQLECGVDGLEHSEMVWLNDEW